MTPREHAAAAVVDFPQRLKAARRRAGLTQDQLVTMAEFAPVTLSKLETGVNSPTFDILVRLAYALDATPNYLVGWESRVEAQEAERALLINELTLTAGELPIEWVRQLLETAKLAPRR